MTYTENISASKLTPTPCVLVVGGIPDDEASVLYEGLRRSGVKAVHGGESADMPDADHDSVIAVFAHQAHAQQAMKLADQLQDAHGCGTRPLILLRESRESALPGSAECHVVFQLDRPLDVDALSAALTSAMAIRQQQAGAAAALRACEQRYESSLQAAGMGTWEWQIDTGKVSWSTTLEEIHGIERDSFPGTFQAVQRDIHPEDRQMFHEHVKAVLEGTQSSLQMRYRIIRPNGAVAWLQSRAHVERDADGQPLRLCGTCTDVTTSKLAEDELARHREDLAELVRERTDQLEQTHHQLRHAERMVAMGTLAAGLGHDLGNLVFPLRIRVDLMRAQELPTGMQADLDAIHKAVQYLQRLANGLRHMAMDPSETGIGVESTDLEEWWADSQAVLTNAIPRGITITRRFDDNLPRTAVPSHALAQAIFNLVQNACEAIGEQSGQIVITARTGADNMVDIAVHDDGPGMTPDVRRRCLEPFFTTKVRGISTGLGLALVHGVVKRADGTIRVESEEGSGTTWTLSFPAVESSQQDDAAHHNQAQSSHAIVDIRDERVGAFVRAMLQTMSISSIAAGEYDSRSDDADMWITDREDAMPGALEFVSKNGGRDRYAVLLNENISAQAHPRIIQNQDAPTSESIRKALRQLQHKRRRHGRTRRDTSQPAHNHRQS